MAAAEGINLCEALEWYEFFSKNDLDVFDVLHGALSVAVLYWPDDFIKKRDDIVQFLNAKKSFDWFRKHKNKDKKKPTSSSSDPDDVMSSPPPPPASMAFQEPSPKTLHWKEEVAANTEETKEKSSTCYENKSSLPTKSDICKPKKFSASLPYEEAVLTTKKKMSTQKIGLRRRLIKKEEKQNHESSKDHHHYVPVSGTILALSANKGAPDVSSTRSAANKEAKTLVLSSSAAAKGTSGLKKDNSTATAKMMKLQSADDEAALERKLEASKRKLHDGYKNAEAAKKRIRLIDDATENPERQRNIVPALNCTSRIRAN